MKWHPKITSSYVEKGRVHLGLHWMEFHLHAPTVHRIPLHIPRRIAVRHAAAMQHPRRGAARPHSSSGSKQVPVGPPEVLGSKWTAEQTWPYRPMARGSNYDQVTSIQLPCLYSISLRPIKILNFRLLGLPSSHF